jgi:colanic acid biosynthesis glycosyl transferase WcaI
LDSIRDGNQVSGTDRQKCQRPGVLFLNRSYWPDVEATGQLLTSLCEGLTHRFRIEVLAGQPNAVIGSGHGEKWEDAAEHHGIRIHRVAHTVLPKKNLIYKSLNFASFIRSADSALRRISAPDVVVFETDPFLLAFSASKLQRRTGCRMVGYLQDIYPDVAVSLGTVRNSWLIRRLRDSLFRVYRRCDHMIVLSRDMADLLVRGGVRPDRISVVPNWACPEQRGVPKTQNQFRITHNLESCFLVMYSGNLGLTQRLEEFLIAAELLNHRTDIQFALVGRGSQEENLRRIVTEKRLNNVRFFDYQPQNELGVSLSAADLHLVPLTSEISQCLMPSKLYGILAAGRPWLTNAPEGTELHEISGRYNAGLIVPPRNPDAIAEKIAWAADHPSDLEQMGRNAEQLAETTYSRARSIEKFEHILNGVLSG